MMPPEAKLKKAKEFLIYFPLNIEQKEAGPVPYFLKQFKTNIFWGNFNFQNVKKSLNTSLYCLQ